MKTLVTIEFESETGNPSAEDIKLFIERTCWEKSWCFLKCQNWHLTTKEAR